MLSNLAFFSIKFPQARTAIYPRVLLWTQSVRLGKVRLKPQFVAAHLLQSSIGEENTKINFRRLLRA